MRNGVAEQDPDPAHSTSKVGDVNKIACRRALKVAWIRIHQSRLQSRINLMNVSGWILVREAWYKKRGRSHPTTSVL